MALYVVATPIGNPKDLSPRAVEVLRTADLIVGEELKALRQILKAAGVQAKAMDQLNEHSRPADIDFLLGECRLKTVALVSDCGTPGFADPGSLLAKACHENGVPVHPVPGASSLMALLSVCGIRADQFIFEGFLPAKTELRAQAWSKLLKENRPVILLETPYRCEKFIEELKSKAVDRLCVIGLNLTQENERVIRAKGRDLAKAGPFGEAEPIVMICPAHHKD